MFLFQLSFTWISLAASFVFFGVEATMASVRAPRDRASLEGVEGATVERFPVEKATVTVDLLGDQD
jgi:hypothetical protein